MKLLLTLLVLVGINFFAPAQDPLRFQEEVTQITERNKSLPLSPELILFTGSSSIRLWKDLLERFPEKKILNTGFGGSHMNDLIYFNHELIIKYKPSRVFIYEGDNDLSGDKTPDEVLKDAIKLIEIIRKELADIPIMFISPKPSLSRWHLKNKYETFNRRLAQLVKSYDKVLFIDVWTVMLDENNKPMEGIFVDDGLHLNEKGYDIWAGQIKSYL